MHFIKSAILTVFLTATASGFAAEPDGYYASCVNKGGNELLLALHSTISSHTDVGYGGLWNVYKTSDVTANNKLWDMYSTKEWPLNDERCGNYTYVGDCINREHSVPQSWFNSVSPMRSDAFHVYPTDGKVNGQRSNYPYGECSGGTTLPSHNGYEALGRLGKCTFPGYTGTVFEPADKYKGDFARSYFYMVAAYNDRITGWSGDAFGSASYPGLNDWVVDLFLKWHRQDPVSRKEQDRNEAIYAIQHNRNPFIDHPELVEYVWGSHKTERWAGTVSDPEILTPADGSTVSLGNASVGHTRTVTVNVRGTALTEAVSASVSGSGFTVTPATLSASDVNSVAGADLTVGYTPEVPGAATAVLTLTSGDVTSAVTVTANALEGLPAGDATDVSDRSFVAHWTYIGGADCNGCYTLTVRDASGNIVDTYPRAVTAADEKSIVDELEPLTAYTYTLATADGLTSNTVSVTTGAPVPSIQFLYDGDLFLTAEPGTPGDPAEILLEIENIDSDITLSVTSPFELSSDKDAWSTSLVVDPREDRFYLRINSAQAGTFETVLTASSGDYVNDETTVSGSVASTPAFLEDFEANATGNYSTTSVQGDVAKWILNNAGVYAVKAEAYSGTNYLRLGKNSDSSAAMETPKAHGVGTVTFRASAWRNDGEAAVAVEYSTDGAGWHTAGTVTLPSVSTAAYKEYNVAVNTAVNVLLRFRQTKGGRVLIDNITADNYTLGVIDGISSDYHSWDAFCRRGRLVVDLAEAATVAVYGMDGISRHLGVLPAGENALDVPVGLYVVVVADFTRRVLVK